MVKTSLKILWRWFLVALSEHLSLLAVQLYHVRQTIFWLCQCLYRPPYYNTNSFFQRSFSHFIMHWWLLDGLFQFINNQGFKWTSFWSFIASCCALILLLPNIVSSKELFRHGTSISRYISLILVSFPIDIFSRPCLLWLDWGLWLIYLRNFWKVFSVLISFFSISNNNILYLFPEICDLSGNFWK